MRFFKAVLDRDFESTPEPHPPRIRIKSQAAEMAYLTLFAPLCEAEIDQQEMNEADRAWWRGQSHSN